MSITYRQAEIVVRVARGLTAREIAHDLGLAPNTIVAHLRAARHRTDSKSSAHLVARWARGEIDVGGCEQLIKKELSQ